MASFSQATPSSRERTRTMSSIDKLLVQGIRSFGATDADKAVIEFGKPLTLITGQNGAGKTTIIECLRYATTGELPPNSKGGAFVHDPKLVGEREVKGVVKLKFHDITGYAVVCSRILQSTQKPRKLEQRTLDSSMEKMSRTGEKIKITSRCGEIDREMISHLGVSKAILNHVIFCHQEESAWPLSEGKALKAKFDEIFASTRYTKALENIRSFQKEQVNECKVYNAELMHLSKQKTKVEELQGDLKETQRKVDASKAEITRIKNELAPAEERLQELNAMYDQVTTLERKIAEHDTSKKELLKNQNELKSKIEHPFTGSKAELEQERDEHHSHLERNSRELKDVERKHGLLSHEMGGVNSELTKCYREHERYKTEEKYHQQRVRLRDEKIVSLASSLKLEGYEQGPFSASAVKRFLTRVAQLRRELEEKATREKQTLLEKERSLQEQMDELRTNLASLEQSRTIKEKTVADNRKEISRIGRELAAIGSGGAALDSAEQELHSAERELSDYEGQVDIPSLENSLRSYHREKRSMDEKVFSLQGELSRIVQQSSARGALEASKKQRRNKEEDYQNQMCGVEAELLSVLGYMPGEEEDLEGKLTHFEREKNQNLRRKETELKRAEFQLSQQRYQKEEKEKQLARKKERMQDLQAEVSDVCGESDGSFKEIVEKVEEDIEETNENISTIKGSQSFFRKSLAKVHASNRCPLCSRQFEDQDSLETTINTLTTRLNESIPKMLPVMTEKLQQLHVRQRRLQELKPKIDEVSLTPVHVFYSHVYTSSLVSLQGTCVYWDNYVLLHNTSCNTESGK